MKHTTIIYCIWENMLFFRKSHYEHFFHYWNLPGVNELTGADRNNLIQQSKYHVCWCPGSLRGQDISTHDIGHVE